MPQGNFDDLSCSRFQILFPKQESRSRQPMHANAISPSRISTLPIALGHTLQLVLLLDRIRVAASLGSVDEFFGKALGDALDVAERCLTGTDGEEGNGLVDTAERGHINGLSAHSTSGSDTGAVFARSAVDNGINGNLDRILVRHDVDLEHMSNYPMIGAGCIQSRKNGRRCGRP